MPYDASAGSGLVFSADKYGTAATPTTDELQPYVSLVTGTAGAQAIVSGTNPLPVRLGLDDVISVTPTVSSGSAYTSGDAVGGKQTLTGACRVSGGVTTLDSLTVVDKGNQKAALTILFFDADPSAATITDNAAFAWSTDISKVVGKYNVAGADYETVDSEAVACLKNIGLILEASGSANLFAAVVTTGTPTYTSTGDLIFKYGFRQN